MKRFFFLLLILVIAVSATRFSAVSRPWQGKAQAIPGRLEFEFYDEGGEGVAYHDTDSSNNGSGKLNPANGEFLNEFRMKDGVDISYTKTGNIDDNPFGKVAPDPKSLYVGWTQPGEWINYTVVVKEPGNYKAALKYTANGNGTIKIDIDGKAGSKLIIPSTHNDLDTVPWRQWHHWNKIDPFCKLALTKGTHLLRLNIVDNGNMNFDYLDITKE